MNQQYLIKFNNVVKSCHGSAPSDSPLHSLLLHFKPICFLLPGWAGSVFFQCALEGKKQPQQQITPVTCSEQCLSFFKDLGSSDLRKDVYVVAHIFRIGKSCCPRRVVSSLK